MLAPKGTTVYGQIYKLVEHHLRSGVPWKIQLPSVKLFHVLYSAHTDFTLLPHEYSVIFIIMIL